MALSAGVRFLPLSRDGEENFTPSATHPYTQTHRSSLLRKMEKARSWKNPTSITCTIDISSPAFISMQALPHCHSHQNPRRKSRSNSGARAAAAFCPSSSTAAAAATSALFTTRSSTRRGESLVELRKALPSRPLLFLQGHRNQGAGRGRIQIVCSAKKTTTTSNGVALDDVPHLSEWIADLPSYPNPLQDNPAYKAVRQYFVEDDDIVAKSVVVKITSAEASVYFRRAGPRENVCFTGEEVRAAIVTCGGLCPGLNTVIREIVCGLWASYGVRDIIGIESGYAGFYSSNTRQLTPKIVNDIHKKGGTILGTSRGGHDKTKIVAAIIDRGINQVYIIGGDGTQKGARVIYEELRLQGVKVVVAGIPKTIDNDIAVIDKSFGFDTAVEEAQRAINAAHVEAESVKNGVGLVKLMGRYSGYIAMYATLASRDVDCCLIPEVPFYLEGKGGLLEFVRKRLRDNGHMVLVVAEGAGQELMVESSQLSQLDASGNRLLLDVGLWLCHHLREHFSTVKESLTLKYIDPTYMVRAIPGNASDNVYCTLLAHSAMHGAMAGYTGFTVGPVNGRHAYIPIATAVDAPNKVSITDRMWARLLASTQQPDFLEYDKAIDAKRKAVSQAPKNDSVADSNNGALHQDREGNVEASGAIQNKL